MSETALHHSIHLWLESDFIFTFSFFLSCCCTTVTGRTAYQYTTNMNNPDNLINLTQKLLVLAGCDASILLTESWVLSTLKIDMFGLLCYSFKGMSLSQIAQPNRSCPINYSSQIYLHHPNIFTINTNMFPISFFAMCVFDVMLFVHRIWTLLRAVVGVFAIT